MFRVMRISAALAVVAVFGVLSWETPAARASSPAQATASVQPGPSQVDADYTVASAAPQPALVVRGGTAGSRGQEEASSSSTLSLFAVGSMLFGLAAAVRRTAA